MAHCCQGFGNVLLQLQNAGVHFALPRFALPTPRQSNRKLVSSGPQAEVTEAPFPAFPEAVVTQIEPLFALRGCHLPEDITSEAILAEGIASRLAVRSQPLKRDSTWWSTGVMRFKFTKHGDLLYQRRGFRTRSSAGFNAQRDEGSAAAPTPSSSIISFLLKSDDGHAGYLKKRLAEMQKEESPKTSIAEESQRIKLAFADGYLKGSTSEGKQSFKGKLFNADGVLNKMFRFLLFGSVIVVVILMTFRDSPIKLLFSSQNEIFPEDVSVTFADVKGIEEAKDEVMEIVEYLRDPDKFSRLGGRLPRGVLLVGPPGTGKTLLARAIAGEAGVPFFHASGSEFDELLVGQGAKRVRDLFATAKDRSPCVVFIDEIDSVGQKRTNSSLHPYANQTVNQLLAEMDGFKQIDGVIVLGASNRKDDLDKALLRPGRFDIQVFISVPDLRGRKEILGLYLSKCVVGEDVDINVLARGTTGFSGADLENLVNKAALRAAADGKPDVNMFYLESSRDKILMGPEKKNRIPDENVNKNTAYHEAGHTLVAFYNKESIPLHKVTIVPRGNALGHTAMIPDKEMYSQSRAELLAGMDVLMGGRVAEELIFGTDQVTTGASNDLDKATQIAHSMVRQYGMSEKVGLRTFQEDRGAVVQVNDLSPSTTDLIDSEIKRILAESYERAKHVLKTHALEHKRLAEVLLEYETLDAKEIAAVINGSSPLLSRIAS